MTRPQVLAVRHGVTSYNEAGRVQGQVDIPLNDVGLWQARTSAAALAAMYRVDAIVSSDLSRALATAQALSRVTGLPVTTDVRLRERAFGTWEGLTGAQIDALDPGAYRAWRAGGEPSAEGAETRPQVAERVAAAVREHASAVGTGTLAVFSHGTALAAGIEALLGLDVDLHAFVGMRNAHWSHLRLREDAPAWRLLAYNLGPAEAAHLWDTGPQPEPADAGDPA